MDIPRAGAEYGTFTVTADGDLTGDVLIAVLPRYRDTPDAATSWEPAVWLDPAATREPDGTWVRRFRVLFAGPDAGTTGVPARVLAVGTHQLWVKLPDMPEVIVRRAGTVTVALTW